MSAAMSGGGKRTPTTATQRLKQDYLRIQRDPVPYVSAEPLPSNILEWHYVVRGPEKTPYEGGLYHGRLLFPREFPFKPPSIYMVTPNGRFKCNTRLCLSISDFHPDSWNPAWSVSTILTGLLSFMVERGATLGSIDTSDYTKRQLAAQSGLFNLRDKVFTELFPDIVTEIRERQRLTQPPGPAPPAGPPGGPPGGPLPAGAGSLGAVHRAAGGVEGGGGGPPPQPAVGLLGGALANIVVLVGFAAFAYTVKYILRSIAQE
uniref:Ubiquitin-conjugating enzyme E2 J2 n=1 Tax=Petromyzon marinus TaxID=7757 RepID=A0AAJ7UHU6_PETMA|nr:ubiquitin-conjugating enzyme E2 J2 [Petromyzon marinus]